MGPAAYSRRTRGLRARSAGVAALLLAGLALAGCGIGPGEGTGDASLWVTRDYGTEVLVDEPEVPVDESSNAMRILDANADLDTAYGGDFVQAVDGLAGGIEGGRSYDWFFSVNGIVAERGSAQFPVSGGDTVWWDYRDWTDAMEVGAVVGAYPAPFSTGYRDENWGIAIDCHGDTTACGMVRQQLEKDGVALREGDANMILRVGTWDRIDATPEGRRLARGPAASGVFARFDRLPADRAGGAGWGLVALDENGNDREQWGADAGLLAALRRGENPPVWLITGGSDAAVRLAAAALNRADLQRRYAAVVKGDRITSLPLP